MQGRLSRYWLLAQQSYWKSLGSPRPGLRWISALITKLWDISWDFWRHRNGVLHRSLYPRRLEHLHYARGVIRAVHAFAHAHLGLVASRLPSIDGYEDWLEDLCEIWLSTATALGLDVTMFA